MDFILLSPCISKPFVEIKHENKTKPTPGPPPCSEFSTQGKNNLRHIWMRWGESLSMICAQRCSLQVLPLFFGNCSHSKVSQARCHAQGFHWALSMGWKHQAKQCSHNCHSGVTLLVWASGTLFMGDRRAERAGKSGSLQTLCPCGEVRQGFVWLAGHKLNYDGVVTLPCKFAWEFRDIIPDGFPISHVPFQHHSFNNSPSPRAWIWSVRCPLIKTKSQILVFYGPSLKVLVLKPFPWKPDTHIFIIF